MNTVARWSWDLMETGIAEGIGPGEETLTDINLLYLRRMIPSMRVTKFAKSVEADNGADWEWWIGSSEEELWLKLHVQAKRSSHDGSTPDGVRYEQVGHETEHKSQRRLPGPALPRRKSSPRLQRPVMRRCRHGWSRCTAREHRRRKPETPHPDRGDASGSSCASVVR